MEESVTFEVFQHALIMNKGSQGVFEDFIVILQKLSSKDPATMKTLMSSRLIELLNSCISHNPTSGLGEGTASK